MSFAVLWAASTAFGAYAVAGPACFDRVRRGTGARAIHALGVIMAVLSLALLWISPPPAPARWLASLDLYVIAVTVYLWAYSSGREEPPAFTRHQFNAAYALMWIAGVIYTDSVLLLAGAIVMIALYGVSAASALARARRGSAPRGEREQVEQAKADRDRKQVPGEHVAWPMRAEHHAGQKARAEHDGASRHIGGTHHAARMHPRHHS
jgi:hypothetical protein